MPPPTPHHLVGCFGVGGAPFHYGYTSMGGFPASIFYWGGGCRYPPGDIPPPVDSPPQFFIGARGAGIHMDIYPYRGIPRLNFWLGRGVQVSKWGYTSPGGFLASIFDWGEGGRYIRYIPPPVDSPPQFLLGWGAGIRKGIYLPQWITHHKF